MAEGSGLYRIPPALLQWRRAPAGMAGQGTAKLSQNIPTVVDGEDGLISNHSRALSRKSSKAAEVAALPEDDIMRVACFDKMANSGRSCDTEDREQAADAGGYVTHLERPQKVLGPQSDFSLLEYYHHQSANSSSASLLHHGCEYAAAAPGILCVTSGPDRTAAAAAAAAGLDNTLVGDRHASLLQRGLLQFTDKKLSEMLERLSKMHERLSKCFGLHVYGAQTDTCNLVAGADMTGTCRSRGGGCLAMHAMSGGSSSSGGGCLAMHAMSGGSCSSSRGGCLAMHAMSGGTCSSSGGGCLAMHAMSGGMCSSSGGGCLAMHAMSGGMCSSSGGGYQSVHAMSGGSRYGCGSRSGAASDSSRCSEGSVKGACARNQGACSPGCCPPLEHMPVAGSKQALIRCGPLKAGAAALCSVLCLPAVQAQPGASSAAPAVSEMAGAGGAGLAAACIYLMIMVVAAIVFLAVFNKVWPAFNRQLERLQYGMVGPQQYVLPLYMAHGAPGFLAANAV